MHRRSGFVTFQLDQMPSWTSPSAPGIEWAIRGERGDDHLRPVVADNEIEATDAAPIDTLRTRRIVAGGSQFTTNRRATGWAFPRHLDLIRRSSRASWRTLTGRIHLDRRNVPGMLAVGAVVRRTPEPDVCFDGLHLRAGRTLEQNQS